MGGFSINREGMDRQSLETAIDILATAERPLILFPEGTTNRTNDVLKPLLDGVLFVARSAARRRAQSERKARWSCTRSRSSTSVRPISPIGRISQLSRIEDRLGWQKPIDRSILQRTIRLAEGLLSLKEVEYFGETKCGELSERTRQIDLRIC